MLELALAIKMSTQYDQVCFLALFSESEKGNLQNICR